MTDSLADRYAGAIVGHSRAVVVILLVVTLVVSAGAAVGDPEDGGIGQFETDSPETDAADVIEADYGGEDAVVAQIVVREEGGDVLTRESLLDSLRLQQELRENETIDATLDDDPIGVENVAGIGAVLEDEGDDLEAEFDALNETGDELNETVEELNETADELEAEFEEFNETIDEVADDGEALGEDAQALGASFERLERDEEALEADFEELGQDRGQLEGDRAQLEGRTGVLAAGLDNATTIANQTDDDAYEDAAEWISDDASDEADLDANATETFEEALELIGEADGDPADPLVSDAFTMVVDEDEGVFADEWDELEQREAELDQREAELGERGAQIGERAEGLAERADEIDEREAELEEREEEIEAWGDELEADAEELGDEFDAIEDEFEALGDRADELSDRADALEDRVEEITLAEQIDALESRSDEEVEELLADVLDPDGDVDFGDEDPFELLPESYEPGETEAEARLTIVFQIDDGGPDEDPEAAYEAQVLIDALVEERFEDAFVFGQGVTDEASGNAVGDSFAIITPVALVLVLFVLGVTYRDVVDVLAGLIGIGLVMAWLAGIQGWLEIPSSQLLIAVPFLLIGLSIDYSLHVVMRYREARAGVLDEVSDGRAIGIRAGMGIGLAGVVLALAAATFSTGVGFLSNVVSPLPAIRDFALLSAGGIFATFVAFGAFVPALKVELDRLLEGRFGRNRAKSPFGVDAGIVNRALLGVVGIVRRGPFVVILVALLLAVGGAYGATGIDTEFNQADFLPQDAPDWAKSLPGPLAAGTYTIADDAEYLGDNFVEQGEGSESQILIRGDVTDPDTLSAIDDAQDVVDDNGTIALRADGQPAIDSPNEAIRELADDNETVEAAVDERDATGNDLPDEDVAGLYDVLYEVDPDRAAEVVNRTDDGEYGSLRLIVDVRGDAASQDVADDTRELAEAIEANAPVTAIATGGPVTTAVIQDALLETLVQAFVVTLVVILAFLTTLYWVRHRSLTLGAVTLAPVVAALAWLLGTMALLDVPFNSETAVITSLAIGLGVDYSIHVSERFVAEREGRDHLDEALVATVTGTGGALLGSAATTAAGFGVLALALAPPLQRFGLVTGVSIVFAFVACLTVLPCLLVVRERLLNR